VTKAASHTLSPRRSDTKLFDGSGPISTSAIAPPAVDEVPDRYDASCKRCVSRIPVPHGADATDPQAASAPPPCSDDPEQRRRLLARLRAKIRALEGNTASWLPEPASEGTSLPLAHDKAVSDGVLRAPRRLRTVGAASSSSFVAGAWTLGASTFDACLPGGCLDPAGLIELKPAAYGDWPVTLMFAACLAVRRQHAASAHRKASAPLLWCTTSHFRAEHGGLYGPGLMHLGLSPESLILVDAPREADALWAIEEGVRSKTLSLVIGLVKKAGLTPSRRLGLATSAGETPALLLTSPSAPPAPSAPLRLRLQRLPAAPDPLNARAPGAARLRLTLERCRGAPAMVEGRVFDLEWCDVTYRFRMAADVADRAYRAPQAGQRA